MKRWLLLSALLSLALLPGCASSKAAQAAPKRLSAEEVAKQEVRAEGARAAFWSGNFDAAIATFEALSKDFTTSQPLYMCELASAELAAGHEENAFLTLQEAYRLLECFYDAKSEKRAQSLWGAESEKVYKGDPYERAMLCLMLGTMYLNRGDYDNALACFKNGQIADGDVQSDLYKSDFGLLQLLEGKCYELRQQPELAEQSFRTAGDSFTTTHPALVTLVANKQGLLDEARGRARASQVKALSDIDLVITQRRQGIDVKYLQPAQGGFNTLLLMWSGTAPHKTRTGVYGEICQITPDTRGKVRYEACIDGRTWQDGIQGLCDVTFQATTRGGRLMDNVLRREAEFKQTTDQIGQSLIDSADDVGDPVGALGLLLVGAVFKGVSASTKVEADVRNWQTLPDSVHLLPLEIEPGAHAVTVDVYDQYLKVGEWRKDFEVKPDKAVNLIWVVPGR